MLTQLLSQPQLLSQQVEQSAPTVSSLREQALGKNLTSNIQHPTSKIE
ncbi:MULTISPECIES: hypothetical protein [Moorena]|nr:MULTISPECIES: hypothetical protein [Moorena]NEO14683.1 hypothetical protein [Moorena sp. SIO3E8]NEO47948.1 hypothetical protein [Moorena sp. SIO4A3]NEP98882.1 hypothetical protein [Moorena sp. SIO3F7]